jgi:hypothetical protein
VAELIGLSRPTILKGIIELQAGSRRRPSWMIRKNGWGCKGVEAVAAILLRDPEALPEENMIGPPIYYLLFVVFILTTFVGVAHAVWGTRLELRSGRG